MIRLGHTHMFTQGMRLSRDRECLMFHPDLHDPFLLSITPHTNTQLRGSRIGDTTGMSAATEAVTPIDLNLNSKEAERM
jgi:hypothetical protein